MGKKVVLPLRDKVVISKTAVEEASSGGILFPECYKKVNTMSQFIGVVAQVGPGVMTENGLIPVDLSVGDKVIFTKYTGTKLEGLGEELILVKESDILAIIED